MDASGSGHTSDPSVSMPGTNRSAAPARTDVQRIAADRKPTPSPQQSASMEQLARATGGVYFHDSTDMLKEFRSALADGRQYYVLAYVPKNTARDGKFRSIVVETTDKKLSIRAKSGYWAAQ
jgi:VWFA-related protein